MNILFGFVLLLQTVNAINYGGRIFGNVYGNAIDVGNKIIYAVKNIHRCLEIW